MFDTVQYRTRCWRCEELLREFQTKDGPHLSETVEVRSVKRFYTTCSKCGAWNEYRVVVKQYEVIFERAMSERSSKPQKKQDASSPKRGK